MKLSNLARMTSATTGTGTLTLGSAVSGYLTFAATGVSDGDVVLYGIKDGINSEVGYGTFTAAGTTLARNVIKSTNSNAPISCSGSEEVYITALASDGGDLLPGTSNPLRGFDAPINLQLNASVASNILAIAIKGNNGADPSPTNPVLLPFRDATPANGDPIWVAVTAALSINTNAIGATLGTVSNVPFRLWIVAFNNAGTVVLAFFQSVTGGATPTAIAPLNEAVPQSTTAISGSATSAGTFYTPNGTALTSKAWRVLGYADYASGLASAGSYATAPTTVQLFAGSVRKPGDTVQTVTATTTSGVAVTSTSVTASNVTASITPTQAPNLVLAESFASANAGATAIGFVQMYRGATPLGVATAFWTNSSASFSCNTSDLDAPGITSSTTYVVKLASDGSHVCNYPATAAVGFAANTGGRITLREIAV